MARILICEKSETLRDLYQSGFTIDGHQVFTASDGIQAYTLFFDIKPDVLLTDVDTPVMSGPELISALRDVGVAIPMVLISDSTTSLLGCPGELVIMHRPVVVPRLRAMVNAML